MGLTTAWAAVLVFVLAAACTACTRGTSSNGKPAATVSVATAGPVDAARTATIPVGSGALPAAPRTFPPVFPVPPTPPGADPEKVLVASSICAAAYLPSPFAKGPKPSLLVGCRAHPPFDEPSRFPDGTLPRFADPDLTRFCAISAIYHGSFTRPGETQAVVAFDGCKDNDSDEWDMAFPGSAVLVEQIDGHWRELDDTQHVNAGRCQKSRRADGRDVLLCQSGIGAGSAGEMSYFFLLDFAWTARHARTLAKIYSDAVACVAPSAPNGLAAHSIGAVTLRDVNEDGTPDLVVDVLRGRVAPSAALDAKLHALCRSPETVLDVGRSGVLPPMKTYRLVIASSGSGFAPTPASRALLDTWAAESPDPHQLDGFAPPLE